MAAMKQCPMHHESVNSGRGPFFLRTFSFPWIRADEKERVGEKFFDVNYASRRGTSFRRKVGTLDQKSGENLPRLLHSALTKLYHHSLHSSWYTDSAMPYLYLDPTQLNLFGTPRVLTADVRFVI